MFTVVRLAQDLYTAYCIESGFLVLGTALFVMRALARLGIPSRLLNAALLELQEDEPVEQAPISLFLSQRLRHRLRSRQA